MRSAKFSTTVRPHARFFEEEPPRQRAMSVWQGFHAINPVNGHLGREIHDANSTEVHKSYDFIDRMSFGAPFARPSSVW